MPGHVKLGKAGEPDPDPSPYLVISIEMKREDMMKPYDPKKSFWVPDGKGGYVEGALESDDGNKAVVMCGHEVRVGQYSFDLYTCFFVILYMMLQPKCISEKDLQI